MLTATSGPVPLFYPAGGGRGDPAHGAVRAEGVEVIDLDFLKPRAVTCQSDFDQADIDRMLTLLDGDDFDEAAADVREWWAEREGTA